MAGVIEGDGTGVGVMGLGVVSIEGRGIVKASTGLDSTTCTKSELVAST